MSFVSLAGGASCRFNAIGASACRWSSQARVDNRLKKSPDKGAYKMGTGALRGN
jgi:hypothetical protein